MRLESRPMLRNLSSTTCTTLFVKTRTGTVTSSLPPPTSRSETIGCGPFALFQTFWPAFSTRCANSSSLVFILFLCIFIKLISLSSFSTFFGPMSTLNFSMFFGAVFVIVLILFFISCPRVRLSVYLRIFCDWSLILLIIPRVWLDNFVESRVLCVLEPIIFVTTWLCISFNVFTNFKPPAVSEFLIPSTVEIFLISGPSFPCFLLTSPRLSLVLYPDFFESFTESIFIFSSLLSFSSFKRKRLVRVESKSPSLWCFPKISLVRCGESNRARTSFLLLLLTYIRIMNAPVRIVPSTAAVFSFMAYLDRWLSSVTFISPTPKVKRISNR